MRKTERSFCRLCINQCALQVDTEDGIVLRVKGDRADPVYGGYTCVKGRNQDALLHHPDRLRHPLRRTPFGNHEPIPSSQAIDEIATHLQRCIDCYGPRSVATYMGTMAYAASLATASPLHSSFMDTIGSRLRFAPNTIDKGGKQVAESLLGQWGAPAQGFSDPEAIILLGINPLVTYTGFPAGSPHRWLRDVKKSGCQLFVVDPRRTDVAKRADVHLQTPPGTDALLLAAIIHVVLAEGLQDRAFIADHVANLGRLRRAVAPFRPDCIAPQIGIPEDDLRRVARDYATARRGYIMAGTGPNMHANGTLVEYLVAVLETICGRWLRAGEPVAVSPTLLPQCTPRAEATSPDPDWRGPEAFLSRGLYETAAGVPSSALPDEILLSTEDQPGIKALISWGGNPAIAFPDQRRTVEALDSLDLFVQIDPWLSASAQLADYVIPPTMPLEAPSASYMLETLSWHATGYGLGQTYANYSRAVAVPPSGSDLVEEWQFFFRLMTAMKLPIHVSPWGMEDHTEALIELRDEPTSTELLDLLAQCSAVALRDVAADRTGFTHNDRLLVQPSRGRGGRLDVGNVDMLHALAAGAQVSTRRQERFPFRLLCRRHDHTYNSSHNKEPINRGVYHNPAFMHPFDLEKLGLEKGDVVVVRSESGSIEAIVEPDPDLLAGTVSMAFGYGGLPDSEGNLWQQGSPVNRLTSLRIFDPYTGQPLMSNVPVDVMRSVGAQASGSRNGLAGTDR